MTGKAPLSMPDAPALVPRPGGALMISPEGEIDEISAGEAAHLMAGAPAIVAHAGFTARRLGLARPERSSQLFDVLELFAFVRPAQACIPTPAGLAAAFQLPAPQTPEDCALALLEITGILLESACNLAAKEHHQAHLLAEAMGKAGWSWAPFLTPLLRRSDRPQGASHAAFAIWNQLPRWTEDAPRAMPGNDPIEDNAIRAHIKATLGAGAEDRAGQEDYAVIAGGAFAPRLEPEHGHIVLAEAGTGTGKTAAYLAPATLWAQANDGAVWVSTYTKNLQRQLGQELDRFYPDPADKRRKAVIRKGRENYLCLLNFAEKAMRTTTGGADPIALGLVARWALASRDGDIVGGDFPGWLADLLPAGSLAGLNDRRGECVYSACEHYPKCFIERTVRGARKADIVVANHALVMAQAAMGDLIQAEDDDGVAEPRTRFVFDEGHHVFDAADSAFSAVISGIEMAEMRRWVRGADGTRSRSRGIEARYGDLVEAMDDGKALEAAAKALKDARQAAAILPGEGWAGRLRESQSAGPGEAFLAALEAHIRALGPDDKSNNFGIEAPAHPAGDALVEVSRTLARDLGALRRPLKDLSMGFSARLTDEAETLETPDRNRLAAASRSLARRADVLLPGWIHMLKSIGKQAPEDMVDWAVIRPISRQVHDVALHRNWIDPTLPFARTVLSQTHGALITSATLRDGGLDEALDENWRSAEDRTGTGHLVRPARRASVPSPFDYPAQTRVLVVTDVRRDAPEEVAGAYEALITAAGGGALGLFTAIRRLKAVHERIAPRLEAAGLALYAQHVDAMDTGSLVDVFRAEENASLLGTDAVRDGVDVPGRSLRLIVFDRVPWPRPDILHKARRAAFGGKAYDDMLTRLKIRQAFGRLIRHGRDTGVFVMLDARTPSRLLAGLPPGVTITRTGLADAVSEIRSFLSPPPL